VPDRLQEGVDQPPEPAPRHPGTALARGHFLVQEPAGTAAEQIVEEVLAPAEVRHERLAADRAVLEVRAEPERRGLVDEPRLAGLRRFRSHAAAALQQQLARSVEDEVTK